MAPRMSSISILVAAGLLACASKAATDSRDAHLGDSLGTGGCDHGALVADREVRTRIGTIASIGDCTDAKVGDVGIRPGANADASGYGEASPSDNLDSTAADGVDSYKKTLQLRLHIPPVEVAAGETFEVSLTIKNTSKSFIAACVGPSDGYMVEVGGKKRFGDSFVSDPTCEEELYLQAGESTKLVRRYMVPTVDPGKARWMARLQILDPTTCIPMGGCRGVTIESQTAGGLIVLPSAAPPTDP